MGGSAYKLHTLGNLACTIYRGQIAQYLSPLYYRIGSGTGDVGEGGGGGGLREWHGHLFIRYHTTQIGTAAVR